jgi:hypothetical protein
MTSLDIEGARSRWQASYAALDTEEVVVLVLVGVAFVVCWAFLLVTKPIRIALGETQ